jgi:hypothetical protein
MYERRLNSIVHGGIFAHPQAEKYKRRLCSIGTGVSGNL